nr:MAG TPA: hypothetical protein [Bacteriophage sp.]
MYLCLHGLEIEDFISILCQDQELLIQIQIKYLELDRLVLQLQILLYHIKLI